MRRRWIGLGVLAASLAGTCLPALAEDVRGRWSFSLSSGILSTKDDIRSNASSLLLNEFGREGDISDDVPHSEDLRQDDLLERETEIEERQTYGLSVAYGLTSWLSIQFDVGYFKGNVNNLDTFRIEQRFVDLDCNPIDGSGCDGFQKDEFRTTPFHDASFPITAGRLEQIPVSFSAVFRFRKDSPFNPFLGAGVGMIFTDFEESEALRDANDAILEGFQSTQLFKEGTTTAAWNRQVILDRFGNQIGFTDCTYPADARNLSSRACTRGEHPIFSGLDPALLEPLINRQFIPTRPFVTTHVEDAFEYHLVGGADYHFNDRWSAFVQGRYVFTRANLKISISDNGNLVTPVPTPDASEAIHFDTDQATFEFLSKNNLQCGVNVSTCAFTSAITIDPNGGTNRQPAVLFDQILVQGGEINLSGFTLGFGLRYTF